METAKFFGPFRGHPDRMTKALTRDQRHGHFSRHPDRRSRAGLSQAVGNLGYLALTGTDRAEGPATVANRRPIPAPVAAATPVAGVAPAAQARGTRGL